MIYDLWIDYSKILQLMLRNELSFALYEDPNNYDEEYVNTETQGLLIWNYSPTLLKEGNIDPMNRVDFYIKPVSGKTSVSGWQGNMYYAINVETHRDIDLTGTRCRYIMQEIVEMHKNAKELGNFPVSIESFKYTPVVYEVSEPQPLVYQPYNRGSVLMKLAFLSCEIN